MNTDVRTRPGVIGRIRSRQSGLPTGLLGRFFGRATLRHGDGITVPFADETADAAVTVHVEHQPGDTSNRDIHCFAGRLPDRTS